jgi:hypothetical protein
LGFCTGRRLHPWVLVLSEILVSLLLVGDSSEGVSMDSKIEKFIAITGKIRTPLALSALIVIVLYGIYQQVLSLDVFEKIGAAPTFLLLQNVLDKLFWLALLGLILGVLSYVVTLILRHRISSRHSSVDLIDASLDREGSPLYEEEEDGSGRRRIRPRQPQ